MILLVSSCQSKLTVTLAIYLLLYGSKLFENRLIVLDFRTQAQQSTQYSVLSCWMNGAEAKGGDISALEDTGKRIKSQSCNLFHIAEY